MMVKSGLAKDLLGEYELAIFLIQLLTMAWSVGIKNGLVSYFPTLPESIKAGFLNGVFLVLLGLSSLVGLIWYMCYDPFQQFLLGDSGKPPSLIVLLYAILSVPIILVEVVLYLRSEAISLFRYSNVSAAAQLVLVAIALLYRPDLETIFFALLIWNVLRLIYLILLLGIKDFSLVDWSVIRHFLLFSLPLIFNMVLGYGMDYIDGIFVTHYFDASFFPVFRYGARELPLVSVLFASLSVAMIPILMKEGIGCKIVRIRSTRLMHFAFPIAIVLMCMSSWLFTTFYSEAFRDSAYIFNVYLLILTSRVFLPQVFNLALHQHAIINIATIIELVSNVVLSYTLVSDFGVMGLAMATVIAYAVQKVILIVYNYRVNGIKLSSYIDLRWYIGYSCVLISVFIYVNYFNV